MSNSNLLFFYFAISPMLMHVAIATQNYQVFVAIVFAISVFMMHAKTRYLFITALFAHEFSNPSNACCKCFYNVVFPRLATSVRHIGACARAKFSWDAIAKHSTAKYCFPAPFTRFPLNAGERTILTVLSGFSQPAYFESNSTCLASNRNIAIRPYAFFRTINLALTAARVFPAKLRSTINALIRITPFSHYYFPLIEGA